MISKRQRLRVERFDENKDKRYYVEICEGKVDYAKFSREYVASENHFLVSSYNFGGQFVRYMNTDCTNKEEDKAKYMDLPEPVKNMN